MQSKPVNNEGGEYIQQQNSFRRRPEVQIGSPAVQHKTVVEKSPRGTRSSYVSPLEHTLGTKGNLRPEQFRCALDNSCRAISSAAAG